MLFYYFPIISLQHCSLSLIFSVRIRCSAWARRIRLMRLQLPSHLLRQPLLTSSRRLRHVFPLLRTKPLMTNRIDLMRKPNCWAKAVQRSVRVLGYSIIRRRAGPSRRGTMSSKWHNRFSSAQAPNLFQRVSLLNFSLVSYSVVRLL